MVEDIKSNSLSQKIASLLREQKLTLSVAESCTGGLLGDLITNVSGSSEYFLGGIIAYDNRVKIGVLGVSAETINHYGAVSEETAKEMAQRVREKLDTTIGISVTGIAGPSGGSPEKPVGLVWIALATQEAIITKNFLWNGTREENKQASANAALEVLRDYIKKSKVIPPLAGQKSKF